MKPVYDEHAQSYDSKHQEEIRASGYSVSHFHEYKVKEIARILPKAAAAPKTTATATAAAAPKTTAASAVAPKTILDFGCGVGNVTPFIRKYFPDADVCGVDISDESIKLAKEKHAGHDISFAAYDMTAQAPFPFDKKFDMILVSCVFQHVPRALHERLMTCLKELLSPAGMLFIFEHNPINPISRSIFKRWDMSIDKDANFVYTWYLKKLARGAGLKITQRNYTVFFPKSLSKLLPLEKCLTWCPLGAQYYIMCRCPG